MIFSGIATSAGQSRQLFRPSGLKPCKHAVHNLDGPVYFPFRDRQRRDEAQRRWLDVVHKQAVLRARTHDLLGDRAVELEGPNQTFTTHLCDHRVTVGERVQLAHEMLTLLCHLAGKIAVDYVLQHCMTDLASERVTTEGCAVLTLP